MPHDHDHRHEEHIAQNTRQMVHQNDQIIAKLNEAVGLLQQLIERTPTMPLDLSGVTAQLDAIEGDVSNVQRALDALVAIQAENEALKAQVADLQSQLDAGAGITQEQIDALSARAAGIDAQFDALAADPAPPAEEPQP